MEAVLDRPDFTLEDLLEEDDLIQARCKHLDDERPNARAQAWLWELGLQTAVLLINDPLHGSDHANALHAHVE